MKAQIAAIIWAQWRTVRNHLPRVGVASVLGSVLSLLWYALFLGIAVALAITLPLLPGPQLREWLPAALLVLCAAWQLIPLFTLSTGWSLQLTKLQIYPLPNNALFGIEVILRLTASPELILILLGGTFGLMRHPQFPLLAPLSILLLLPINLLLSLAVRELVLHSFERNRFREIFSLLLVCIAIVPQFLIRTGFAAGLRPYLFATARAPFTPWDASATLALGVPRLLDLLTLLVWLAVTYLLARWFFLRSLLFEETPQAGSLASFSRTAVPERERGSSRLVERFLGDPLAALVQKELQALVRMPRFRMAFGMACIFSVIIVFPIAMNSERAGSQFVTQNFLPFVTLYGVLILSDSLLLNIFGTDRAAVAFYFLAPVPFRTVLWAKNLTAIFFLTVQATLAMLAAAAVRRSASVIEVVTAAGAVAVVGLFFLSVGNLTSVLIPRPSDPRQMMRKSAGGKLQLWLLLCMLGMGLLLGAAYLAELALDSYWGLFGVLALEFALGLIVHKVATDSAVEHGERDREQLVDALSKGTGLVGSNN